MKQVRALEVCSQQGAIQIHANLYLYQVRLTSYLSKQCTKYTENNNNNNYY